LRIPDALELHHVFEGEGMLGLGECGKRENHESKKSQNETAHNRTSEANGEKCSRFGSATVPGGCPAGVPPADEAETKL
jgi:hypothetical protein